MTKTFQYITLLLGFGLQVVNLSLVGLYFLNILPIIFLLGWIFSEKYNITWLIHTIFVLDIILIGWLSFLGFPPLTLVLMVVFMLAGWNLTDFRNLLKKGNPNQEFKELVSRHLTKLGLFILLSLIFSTAATLVEIKTTFFQSIVLLIISFIAIMQVFRWNLKRTNAG